jgi:hypothetical protein
MTKVMGYAGRKPKRQGGAGENVSGISKHSVWAGVYLQVGFHAEGNSIKPDRPGKRGS